MYYIFYACLIIFWILDILNVPFMAMFDTTYAINGWAWFLIWLLIPHPKYDDDNTEKKSV